MYLKKLIKKKFELVEDPWFNIINQRKVMCRGPLQVK